MNESSIHQNCFHQSLHFSSLTITTALIFFKFFFYFFIFFTIGDILFSFFSFLQLNHMAIRTATPLSICLKLSLVRVCFFPGLLSLQ